MRCCWSSWGSGGDSCRLSGVGCRGGLGVDLKRVLAEVLREYRLPLRGDHGVVHWARVLENGLRLAGETGASEVVVSLFAVLHDSRRLNEHHDPGHGPRAAAFAKQLRGRVYDVSDEEQELLVVACAGHTSERWHADITVQTCWDADRLDLLRVGITPDPARLCTAAARKPDVLRWACERAEAGYEPEVLRGLVCLPEAGFPN